MPETPDSNRMAPSGRTRSLTLGDVPDSVRRRYYVDGRGILGLAFYVDATIKTPAFHDRGVRLTTARSDPNAIRHMTEIALHRGWTVVLVRGDPEFRREAWLAGRLNSLEVHGYKPTVRDLEALQRRLAAQRPREETRSREPSPPSRTLDPTQPGLKGRLNVVETVVRGRVRDPQEQDRILTAARARIASWLERGATFPEAPARDRRTPERQERSR
jgi:hypothetical protein